MSFFPLFSFTFLHLDFFIAQLFQLAGPVEFRIYTPHGAIISIIDGIARKAFA